MDDTEAVDGPSVFAACGRAWICGSFTALPMTFGMVAIYESVPWGWPSLWEVFGFVMLAIISSCAAAIVSGPFMLIVGFPLAFVASRYLGRSLIGNSIFGGMVGALAGAIVPLSFFMLPGFTTAAYAVPYGAFTGFFVTRMRYG